MKIDIKKTEKAKSASGPSLGIFFKSKVLLTKKSGSSVAADGEAAALEQPGKLNAIKDFLAKPRGRDSAESYASEGARSKLFFRLPLQEQMLFAKRLSILLKAGVPILPALNMMLKQTQNRSAKAMVADLVEGAQNGQFMHSRLEKYRQSFGDFAVNIIRVGEVSGTLHENLDYLAQELKKKKDLKRKVVSALVYPAFIIAATIGITVMLIVYVFPKILPVLQTFKGTLPFTTRTLIYLSHLLATQGWYILLGVIFIAAAWLVALRRIKIFRLAVDRGMLYIPVLGKLFRSYHMSNFCRTFGILLKSDVRIVEASQVTARTSTNAAYRKSLDGLSEQLLKGEKLSAFFETRTKPVFGEIATAALEGLAE